MHVRRGLSDGSFHVWPWIFTMLRLYLAMISRLQCHYDFQPYFSNAEANSNPILADRGLQVNWWWTCWPDPGPLSQTPTLLQGSVGGWVFWQPMDLFVSQSTDAKMKKKRKKETKQAVSEAALQQQQVGFDYCLPSGSVNSLIHPERKLLLRRS